MIHLNTIFRCRNDCSHESRVYDIIRVLPDFMIFLTLLPSYVRFAVQLTSCSKSGCSSSSLTTTPYCLCYVMLQNKTTPRFQWLTSTKNYFQFTIHFHWTSTVAGSHSLHCRMQADGGAPIWDIASVVTVQGKKEYSGNT